jgi:hypothetical protein
MELFEEENKKDRFFRKLLISGLPSKEVLGEHTISNIPKKMAEFLQLPGAPDYNGYKSHTFRHSGATILADTQISSIGLKQAGGWQSLKVAESYVERSVPAAMETAKRLSVTSTRGTMDNHVHMSQSTAISNQAIYHPMPMIPSINITGSTNCVVNLNIGTYPTTSVTENVNHDSVA